MTTKAPPPSRGALTLLPPPAAHVALARQVAEGPAHVIALSAADPSVHVWPALVRLGQGLHRLTGAPIALYPAPGSDPRQLEQPTQPGLVVSWLPAMDDLCDSAAVLVASVTEGRGRYGHQLIDLTGFLPDLRELLRLPDRIVSVARAGHTPERALWEFVDRLPPSRHAGVLLVGKG